MIAEQLILYRKENQLTQTELAAKIHVSRQTVSHWENGRSTPDIQSLILLCELYHIDLKTLLSGDAVTMQAQVSLNRSRKLALGVLLTIIATYVSLLSSNWLYFTYSMMLVSSFSTLGVVFSVMLNNITQKLGLKKVDQLLKYIIIGKFPVNHQSKAGRWQTVLYLFLGALFGLSLSFLIGVACLGWTIPGFS